MSVLKNAKREHFAQLVANGKTPPQAYIQAGYSEKGAAQSANRLLKDAAVVARVEELRRTVEEPARERAIEKAALTRAWVISELMENVTMAKQAVPVTDREGNETGTYQQNLSAANKALELLGKELGMFVDRMERGKPGDFDHLSDDEVLARRQALDVITRASDAAKSGASDATKSESKTGSGQG